MATSEGIAEKDQFQEQAEDTTLGQHQLGSDRSDLLPELDPTHHHEPVSDIVISSTPTTTPFQIYSRRWYILGLFAVLGVMDNVVYSTLSPIAPVAEDALGLSQTDISLLANWYNIMFIVGVFPYMWLIQNKGLRMPVLSGIAFVAIGAFVRCLNTKGASPAVDKMLLHLGQIINGLSSSVLWFACTKLSVVWFPPSERTVSTSFGLMSGGFGVAISFLVGPYTVNGLASKFADGDEPSKEDYAQAIRFLLYIECTIAGILCALALFYFPSEPPIPPSFTAKSERFEFSRGLLQFAKNKDCWLILILYSLSGATYGGWTQFLAITLEHTMDSVQIGWLGFAVTVAMVISGPITSLTAKYWVHRCPKLVCGTLMFLGAGLSIVFLVASVFVKSMLTSGLAWGTVVPAAFFVTSCQPIWWEMASEAAYPIPEQIVGAIFALGYTVCAVLYYLFYSFPSLGTEWANWCLAIGECACVPIIFFYSGKSRRLAEDIRAEEGHRTDIIQ